MEKFLKMVYYNKVFRCIMTVILSCINVYLITGLELWTRDCSKRELLLFDIICGVICYLLVNTFVKQMDKRMKRHTMLWGMFMATAYVLGCRMRRDGTVLAEARRFPQLVLCVLCLSLLAASCIMLFMELFYRVRLRMCIKKHKKRMHEWQVLLFSMVLILLCWAPLFLSYYPGILAYDAGNQLRQVFTGNYSTHHPLIHTLFLGFFIRLGGKVFGSYTAGAALHSLVQMLLMASCFGYTLTYLWRKDVSLGMRIGLLLFYALFPVNSILALSATKDVLFSALVLLHTLMIYQIIEDVQGDMGCRVGIVKIIMFILCTVLMLLFRNNAAYAFFISVPVICFGIHRDKKRKNAKCLIKYLIIAISAFILFAVSKGALRTFTDAEEGSYKEMLSIPLQQMARVRVEAEDRLSSEMRQELEQYLSSEWVFTSYNPHLADPIKAKAEINGNFKEFMAVWIALGLQHPQIYIDAFLDNSIGYWFWEDQTHAQIYGTDSGYGYLSTGNRKMPDGCEIIENSYLPDLRAAMERIVTDNIYQNIPVLRILFAPAFYWWMLCMYVATVIYWRKYQLLLPQIFMIMYYITLLLSPAVLIRYMYPLVITVPAMWCCLSNDQATDIRYLSHV